MKKWIIKGFSLELFSALALIFYGNPVNYACFGSKSQKEIYI